MTSSTVPCVFSPTSCDLDLLAGPGAPQTPCGRYDHTALPGAACSPAEDGTRAHGKRRSCSSCAQGSYKCCKKTINEVINDIVDVSYTWYRNGQVSPS